MNSIEKLGLEIVKFIEDNNLVWSNDLRKTWERADRDTKLFEPILDQAIKDQKDAERYMHLKWVITSKSIEEWLLIDKTDAQIDAIMDERIRSYDE